MQTTESDDDILFGPPSTTMTTTTIANNNNNTNNPLRPMTPSTSSSAVYTPPQQQQSGQYNNNNNNNNTVAPHQNPSHNHQQQQQQQEMTDFFSSSNSTNPPVINNNSNNNNVVLSSSPPVGNNNTISTNKNTTSSTSTSSSSWIPRTTTGDSWGYKVVFTPPTQYELQELEKEILSSSSNDNNNTTNYNYQQQVPSNNQDGGENALPLAHLYNNHQQNNNNIVQYFYTSSQAKCALCGEGDIRPNDDPLFKPCPCDRVWHRATCFRKWRRGIISPRNYWSCPDCLYNYNMERIRDDHNFKTKEEIKRKIWIEIAKLWVAILFGVAATTAILAVISYGADSSEKNIPVVMKSMLTSVLYGFPEGNQTDIWREEFKDPDVSVSEWYGMFGGFLCALVILGIASCSTTSSNVGVQDHDVATDDDDENTRYK